MSLHWHFAWCFCSTRSSSDAQGSCSNGWGMPFSYLMWIFHNINRNKVTPHKFSFHLTSIPDLNADGFYFSTRESVNVNQQNYILVNSIEHRVYYTRCLHMQRPQIFPKYDSMLFHGSVHLRDDESSAKLAISRWHVQSIDVILIRFACFPWQVFVSGKV